MWNKITGFANYSANDAGLVRNDKTGRILRPGVQERGYLRVVLCEDGKPRTFSLHRLIAETFLGPRPEGMEINHKNGRPSDNRLDNLEYVTQSENLQHSLQMRHEAAKIFSLGTSRNRYGMITKVKLDFERHEFFVEGERAHLPYSEARTLRHLAENRSRVVGREELKRLCGRKDGATSRTVDVTVARIRKALGRHVIETVALSGYRISDHIEVVHR